MPSLDHIVEAFKQLQDEICSSLEACDGKAKFEEDLWDRPGGGGGRTRLIRNGNVFEQGGVNFSHVHGELPPAAARQLKQDVGGHFDATGVSIVIHPRSPRVPIIHMNVRYFQMDNGKYWFGGGIDLTPIYVVEEDARFFHTNLKNVCDAHDPTYYPRFKKRCDEYFYIKHRSEMRGIGGVFFDHIADDDQFSKQDVFDFTLGLGRTFAPTYTEIVNRRRDDAFTEAHKEWQRLRRGRYVEFNLVYDRGTRFGLETGGRTASILMSLPPVAGWEYNHSPKVGSEEQKTLDFLQPQDWI
ncbi:MAG: oxygen-dependent coproporphyrinogen oxidase [Bacteroidia bacterium]